MNTNNVRPLITAAAIVFGLAGIASVIVPQAPRAAAPAIVQTVQAPSAYEIEMARIDALWRQAVYRPVGYGRRPARAWVGIHDASDTPNVTPCGEGSLEELSGETRGCRPIGR